MLLIGQERSRDSAALAVESRRDPIVPVVTEHTNSRRVSGSYNRRERGGRLLLTELGYKVIVAHAQKVQLITKSNRKDDRHDARTLARLARIDPELLGPVPASQRASANLPDGDPCASRTGACSNGRSERGTRGHVLMENRNGLLVQTFLTEANGRAERDAAMLMMEAIPSGKRVTLGGNKNYDTQEFVRELRGMNISPHVAQNDTNRRRAVDQRTTRHAG
jgi:hypothetical protein